MLGCGWRTGVRGRAGGPRAFPPHSSFAGDVTPVSPVLCVTGVAFSRVSSPIWWLSCVIFFFVSLRLLSGFFVFGACELRTGRKDGGLEKGQGLQSYLCFSHSSLSLGIIWRSRLMSFPPVLPCCAISPRVARNDLIVLAKPQFVLVSPSQSPQKAIHPAVMLASEVGQMNGPRRGHFYSLTSLGDQL